MDIWEAAPQELFFSECLSEKRFDKEVNMKIRIRIIFAALLVIVLLAGCNLGGLGKPSVVSLTKDAIKNLKKVESAEAKIKTDGDISAVYETLNIGMNITLDSETDMEMTKDPERAKGSVNLIVGAVGQEQTVKGRFYRDRTDTDAITYVKWENGDWMKKTSPVKQKEAEDEKASKGITMPDSVMQAVGLLKYLSDGSLTAQLNQETVQVNEKEAYQISSIISGDLLRQLIENGTINLGEIDLNTEEIDWANVSVPAELYIYKDSKLPARITLDCTAIGSQVVGNMLKDDLEQLPFGKIRVDVSKFVVDITIDKYNEIEAIEIPAETAGAVESENLTPTLTDFFQF